jgi:DUF2934 family protein
MVDQEEVENRIRERAFQIWLSEGQPDGRDREHWEMAKLAIAEQDGLASALIPSELPEPEPIEAVKNRGEFPTLVDQGEGQSPPENSWR